MVTEIQVEKRLVKHIKQHGGMSFKFEVPGHSNLPDRLIFMPGGRVYVVELKKPKGKARRGQLAKFEKIRFKTQLDIPILTTYTEVDAFIEAIT